MLKKLFVLSFFIAAMFVAAESANAQRLYFCEDVTADGRPIGESSSFTIANEGDYLKFLVRLPYEIGCRKVNYVIYRNGNYDNTITQEVQRDWVWFYKEISFYKTGNYTIYVQDCNGDNLTSENLRINWR